MIGCRVDFFKSSEKTLIFTMMKLEEREQTHIFPKVKRMPIEKYKYSKHIKFEKTMFASFGKEDIALYNAIANRLIGSMNPYKLESWMIRWKRDGGRLFLIIDKTSAIINLFKLDNLIGIENEKLKNLEVPYNGIKLHICIDNNTPMQIMIIFGNFSTDVVGNTPRRPTKRKLGKGRNYYEYDDNEYDDDDDDANDAPQTHYILQRVPKKKKRAYGRQYSKQMYM